MDFNLDPKHQMIKEVCRKFADNEVETIAAEIDETERFPLETIEKMGKLGLMGISIPKEYGGAGAGYTGFAIAIEEISKSCATTSVILVAHTSLCASMIYNSGNKEQKQKYLVPLAKGEKLGAFGLTEPNAGSDASNQQTTAVLNGDHYLLNGSKIFITNGAHADTYVITAMTDTSKGLRGISAFIIEKGWEGFSFGPPENKMGIRGSSTTELIFQDIKVPKENLIGKEGQGFKMAMMTLDAGRIVVAAQALGIAEAALEESIKYVKERIQFKKPLSKQQIIQFMIADMATEVENGRNLVYKSAWLKDNGKSFGISSSMAKLYCSEMASRVTNKAIQLHGGYGYIKDYKVERLMRDARITEIYEGTSEIQRTVISSSILK
ncbi:acyl-CoA dehydrogenase [Alkalibaculum sp. M08DMB]|uniref:Acyl-CoA dehydrogenase n=1 Tax=Alkalibaculum sporogenes TaxID=2655001 RepID=A0A6A7KBG3_9FIRM|nr:acyl-CoA dehydrogenase [Alkalibaculum sporogenes]MPW26527.1 acyl-CoA dehydrogenase [Alkalibaculum sporogenes]